MKARQPAPFGGGVLLLRLLPLRACCLAAVLLLLPSLAAAQNQTNPVYLDDSTRARETLSRVSEFIAAGNEPEAVRELQRLLDADAERVIAHPGRPDVYITVRQRVHSVLKQNRGLLERYRQAESARAREQLESNDFRGVERSRFLTPAGLEATLRLAQVNLEAGRFEASRLALLQLEDHPDRRPGSPAARDAARLLQQTARYLDRPAVWARADRWAQHAGLPVADQKREAVEPPPSLQAQVTDFVRPGPATDHDNVPASPIWSTTLEPRTLPLEVIESVSPNRDSPLQAENLWVLPTVVGDTVYINDGTFISARDRFTLQPRWSARPTAAQLAEEEEYDPWAARREAFRMGSGRFVEDTSTVTVNGRLLIATMGFAQSGMRQGDAATYALDAATGRVLWSVLLRQLDPQLDGASVRGPAMIEGDMVILAARKSAPGRRVTNVYLVGLSATDGSLVWLRPIASAGAIPWTRGQTRVSQAALLHEGVVYFSDAMGVVAAVEAAGGRPVWVRKAQVPTTTLTAMREVGMPWEWSMPIADRDAIILVSPDFTAVLRIDRASGEILARRPASVLRNPAYLLRAGDRLAAVGRDNIAFLELAEFEAGTPLRRSFGQPGIRGRVAVAGNHVHVPLQTGIAVIDPASPGEDVAMMRLERLGNILPVGDQMLVIDSDSIHSYLSWDVARRLLNERIEANPSDPHPSITFAELAYRAGRHNQIAAAADQALAAIERGTGRTANVEARQRLFLVLRNMVEASQQRWAVQERENAAIQPGGLLGRPEAPESRRQAEVPVLDLPVMAQVIERLGRAARTPEERVTHLMSLGRMREAQAQAPRAAEAYQRILAEQPLATAVWRGPGVAVRAEIEAARRIRHLVRSHGAGAYAAFEAQAAAELELLGDRATAEQLEQLARRYPAAAVGATIWARAADIHDSAGRTHAAIAALREALAAAEQAHVAGSPLPDGMFGDLAGGLIVRLEDLEQYFAAAQLIGRLRAQYPDLVISDRGTPMDSESLAEDLMSRLAALERLPRIGPQLEEEPQALPGWSIMVARSQDHSRACEHIMMVSSSEKKIALWGIPGATGDGSGAEHARPGREHLQMLWTRSYTRTPPILLRLDPDSAYIFWDRVAGADGPMIERISTVSGETRWRTDDIRTFFPEVPGLDQRIAMLRNTIDSPIDGPVRLTDVLISLDEQVIVVAERSGRIAAFDPATGGLLWSIATPLVQVHDVDAGAGYVVVGGETSKREDDVRADGPMGPMIVVYDTRTGDELHKLEDLSGQVRWLRLASGSGEGAPALIGGLQAEIVSFDLVTGNRNWNMQGGLALGSLDAWVLGDLLFVLSEYRTLMMVELATGNDGTHLETDQHLGGRGLIRAMRLGPERSLAAFTTDRGVVVFDRGGRLVGMDGLLAPGGGSPGALLHPMLSENFFVTVETSAQQGRMTRPTAGTYSVHWLDTTTAMLRGTRALELEMPPRRMALLDGRVLVTAGNNTLVYAAPVRD